MKTFEQIKLNDVELGLFKFLVEGPNTRPRTTNGHKFRNELEHLCGLELIRYVDENVYIRTERGIDYLHYHRETPTPLTMIIDGKVYEDGKLYMTSNGSVGWFYVSINNGDDGYIHLRSIIPNTPTSPFKCGDVTAIDPADLGAITDAPLELIDGEWYMCHWEIQTGNETCKHFRQPLRYNISCGFTDLPMNALLFKPLHRMGKV